jgi:hypothetical protein
MLLTAGIVADVEPAMKMLFGSLLTKESHQERLSHRRCWNCRCGAARYQTLLSISRDISKQGRRTIRTYGASSAMSKPTHARCGIHPSFATAEAIAIGRLAAFTNNRTYHWRQTGLSVVLIHCLAAPTFARYHATVASMPARNGILGSHPASRKTETSNSLRGVPSGFVGSQWVSPL